MLRYKNKGYTIEINLPEECGYKDYSVECTYQFDKEKEKYLLSMWLKRNDIDDKFKIDSQEIDTQYISGTKENIRQNIRMIVEQASLSGFFNYYIEKYEYTCKCFELGNALFELETLNCKGKVDNVARQLCDLLSETMKTNTKLSSELFALLNKYESKFSEGIGA